MRAAVLYVNMLANNKRTTGATFRNRRYGGKWQLITPRFGFREGVSLILRESIAFLNQFGVRIEGHELQMQFASQLISLFKINKMSTKGSFLYFFTPFTSIEVLLM